MSEDPNPRERVGGNVPPLDPPETLAARLEREYAPVFSEVAQLKAASYGLPEKPATDEECGQLSDHVVKLARVARQLEDIRTTEGKPYLEGTRIINATFNDVRETIVAKGTGLAAKLTERVRIYTAAKAERERAERLAREAEERKKVEAARAEEERQRKAAEAATAAADAAAAAIRNAATAAERNKAEAEMREQEGLASQARAGAEIASDAAAGAERRAETNARAAAAPVSKFSKVAAGGSTASVTLRWTYRIDDMGKLRASLGPLESYLTEDIICAAVARAVREQSLGGATPTIKLPGVAIFQHEHTNISATR